MLYTTLAAVESEIESHQVSADRKPRSWRLSPVAPRTCPYYAALRLEERESIARAGYGDQHPRYPNQGLVYLGWRDEEYARLLEDE